MAGIAEHQVWLLGAISPELIWRFERPAVPQRRHRRHHQHRILRHLPGPPRPRGDDAVLTSVAPLPRLKRRIQTPGFKQDGRQCGPIARLGRLHGVAHHRRPLQKLFEYPSRGEGDRRDEAGHQGHEGGQDFPVRWFASLFLHGDETIDQGLIAALRIVPRPLDRLVDNGADPRRTVERQGPYVPVSGRIGKEERRSGHRPFGERIGVGHRHAEITRAGLGRHPGDKVADHVDPASRPIDKRFGEASAQGGDQGQIRIEDYLPDHLVLAVVGFAIQAQDAVGSAGQLGHFRTEWNPKRRGILQDRPHVGFPRHHDQPSDAQVGADGSQNVKQEEQEAVEEPDEPSVTRAVGPKNVQIERQQRAWLGLAGLRLLRFDRGEPLQRDHRVTLTLPASAPVPRSASMLMDF